MQDLKFGHIVIERNGIECTCGRKGCLEAYASMKALRDKIAIRKNLKIETGKELYEIIKNDRNEIQDIIDEFINNLCIRINRLYKYI